jgi:lysophospholipase L1-like esterase
MSETAARAGSAASGVQAPPRVLLLGDSIRIGYQPHVADLLSGIAQVQGPAENGGDTRKLLALVLALKRQPPPAVVHVNAGLHDIKRTREAGDVLVPLDEYRGNVRALLARLRAWGVARVVWATMTPVDETRHAVRKAFDRRLADVQAYNAAAVAEACALDVPVNDLYAQLQAAGGGSLLWHDGIHLTDDGYRLLGIAVAAFLRPLITEPTP